jgi:polyisoprenoid-binding protein YceI
MIRRAFCLCVALVPLGLASAGPAAADTYMLDPQHTEVRFTWDHLGLSRQGGRFVAAEGTVTFDPAKPETSMVDVKIPVKGISTGVKKLDEHLITTKDFFDVAAFPAITFKSTAVRMKSDKTGEVEGDLSINGITKPVVLDVIWNFTGEHPLQTINPVYAGAYASGFSATTQIRRSDWGITRTIPYISDELRITIETEMIRTAESPVAEDANGAGDLPPLPETPGPDGSGPDVTAPDAGSGTAPNPDVEK